MPDQKTTVYLEPAEYRKLQALARLDGRSAAELIREAVAEYNARRMEARLPRSLGAGRSGREDFSERSEEMLAGMGEEE
jgi:predicted transcriptional regulator